jgi:hypothetical protein
MLTIVILPRTADIENKYQKSEHNNATRILMETNLNLEQRTFDVHTE